MIEKIPGMDDNIKTKNELHTSWDAILRIMNLVDRGFFIIQANGLKIVQANAHAVKLTGYSIPELVGKDLIGFHLSDEIPLLQLEIQRLEFERETEIEGIRILQKNGFQIPVDIKLARLPGTGEEGPTDYFLAVYRESIS
ncbi:MAG TPA: PAS domain S-box protein, partial [Bacteroidetes bacterium]|nr:PAS domain S-box protein [Bacteroidota bacterium]